MSVNGTSRVQKPRPTRVDPLRNLGGLLGQAPSAAQSNADERAAESLVERGVRAGYEVIGEYLNEARSAARSFSAPGPEAESPASPEQLTERLFQHASDLGSVWMDLVRTLNRRHHDDATQEKPGGFSTNGANDTTGGDDARVETSNPSRSGVDVPISVLVSSPLPVRVDVRLHASPPATGGVATHAPRRAEDEQALRGVTLEWLQNETLGVRLRLESGVEPGTYTSVLVARESNLPFGTLCVVVEPNPGVQGADLAR